MKREWHWLRVATVACAGMVLVGCGAAAAPTSPTTATPLPVTPPAPTQSGATAPTTTEAPAGSGPVSTGIGKAFVMTGVLPAFPQGASIDPTTFVSTIPDTTNQVFVLYLLGAGFNGTIDATWTDTDTGATFTHTEAPLQYPGTGPNWEWDSSNVAGGWLPAGPYTVVFKFEPTGETASVSFTITGTSGSSSPTTPASTPVAGSPPASAGSSPFVIAGLSASNNSALDTIDVSTFATSFPASTDAIYAEYALTAGLSGTVNIAWNSPTDTQSYDYSASDPWAWFGATVSGRFSPGPNTAVLTFEATGQSITLPFTITSP
jgi:hypothetical protein